MRGIRKSAAVLAGAVITGATSVVSACGAQAPVFHPSGALPAGTASGPASLLPSVGAPAGPEVDFETPLPSGGLQRAIVLGYERYARSHWARSGASGPIRYFDTAITGVYFGDGAAVASCVAAGQRRYRQEVAEGRRADGGWVVTHSDIYPVTTSEGATCQ